MKKVRMMMVVLFTLMASFTMVNAKGIEVPEDIRVGLYYGSNAVETLRLSSPGGIEIGIMCDGEFETIDEVGKNEEIVIKKSDENGAIYIENIGEIGSKNEYPYFRSLEKNNECLMSINGKLYRGNVEIRRFSDSDMTVINHLSMQEYLYGVVPREIGGNSPIEAVKAQAIVARTYAVKNYGRRAKWGFDVYPTVDDQAYGGYTWENVNSNKAVDETDGQVIVYNGELIGGYYFSTSGGYTENSENVWGGKYDYLKAVPDYYELEVAGNTTWEVEYTADEVKAKLANYGIHVGDIIDIEPVEFTDVGRVLELKVIGTDGDATLTKSNTRTYLGLKSQWYTVNDEAPEVLETELPNKNNKQENEKKDAYENSNGEEEYIVINPDYANNSGKFIEGETKEMKPLLKKIVDAILGNKGTLEKETEEEKKLEYKAVKTKSTFTFRGRGWGHAVGMSQNGAKGMAEEGFSCEDIITWYYSGVEILN